MLRILILLVALAAGGGAAWMTVNNSGNNSAVNTAGSAPATVMADVLVAATNLAPGVLVAPAVLRWQPWPKEAINTALITRDSRPNAIEQLEGLMVRNEFIAGEPIYDSKLSAGDIGALSVTLQSGMRAVAVRISAESSAGGFILPNDHVDVLHTITRQNGSGQSWANSRVILKNVKVLAVDQTIEGSSDAVVGKTATLELTPEEVEIVAASEASGSLFLALRSLADNDEETTLAVVENRTLRIFRSGKLEVVELN